MPPEDAKRVLLVEQHHALRAALRDLVTSWGHVVRDAANGRQALAIALWWQPEVVCLDLDLPLMSAYDVAKSIAAFGESRPVLIGVSGVGRAAERQRAVDAGFDAFVVKPGVEALSGLLRGGDLLRKAVRSA